MYKGLELAGFAARINRYREVFEKEIAERHQ